MSLEWITHTINGSSGSGVADEAILTNVVLISSLWNRKIRNCPLERPPIWIVCEPQCTNLSLGLYHRPFWLRQLRVCWRRCYVCLQWATQQRPSLRFSTRHLRKRTTVKSTSGLFSCAATFSDDWTHGGGPGKPSPDSERRHLLIESPQPLLLIALYHGLLRFALLLLLSLLLYPLAPTQALEASARRHPFATALFATTSRWMFNCYTKERQAQRSNGKISHCELVSFN